MRHVAPHRKLLSRRSRQRRVLTPIFRADAALFASAAGDWRKVARVVSDVWQQLPSRWRTEAGVTSLSRRVARLVAAGKLESQGDVRRIRFSEVRLARRRGGDQQRPAAT